MWSAYIHAAAAALVVGRAAAGGPAYSFRNPFDAMQCEPAIAAGRAQLARNSADARGRMLLAEGFLCRGLDDDPSAVDEAIARLRQIVTDEPANFWARLDLADALRKRFPLSEEAENSLQLAHGLLDRADVGAARQDLAAYIEENSAAISSGRVAMLPVLQRVSARAASSSDDVCSAASILMQTGIAGLGEAERRLDEYLRGHPDDARAALFRAEVSRGRVPADQSRRLYAAAASPLCDASAPPSMAPSCSLARWRLEQLERSEREAHGAVSDRIGAREE